MDGRSYYDREVAPDLLLVALDHYMGPIFMVGADKFSPIKLNGLKLHSQQIAKSLLSSLHTTTLFYWHPDEEAGIKNWNWFAVNNAPEIRKNIRRVRSQISVDRAPTYFLLGTS